MSKVEISKERYIDLLVAEEELCRLNAGGVDNWDWHWESLNPDGEPTMEEFKTALALTAEASNEDASEVPQ